MRYPIRFKLTGIIFIIVFPLVIFSIYHYFEMRGQDEEHTLLHNREVSRNIADDFDRIIDKSFDVLKVLSKHPAVYQKKSKKCDRLFTELLPSDLPHANIFAVGMDGYTYGIAVPSFKKAGLNFRKAEWFQKASTGVATVSDLYSSNLLTTSEIVIAMPVYNQQKQIAGVIGFLLDLSEMKENISRLWPLPEKSSIAVLDSKRNTIIDTDTRDASEKNSYTGSLAKKTMNKPEGSGEGDGTDGVKRFYSFTSLSRAPWKVIVTVPAEHVYHHAKEMTQGYIIILGSVACAALLWSLLLSRRITKNLSHLIAGMDEIKRGNSSVDLKLSGRDELNDLANAFNQMVRERKAADERIRRSEDFVKNILETIDEGFIVIDRDYRILSANKAYLDQVGMQPDEVIGRHCHEISHHIDKPCSEAGEDCSVKRTFDTGEPSTALHIHQDKEKNTIYVETKSYPLKDSSGKTVSAIEIINNTTEKKKLEEQLRHSQKMEAIGQLAGGVAHDFNNILTAIIGYGSIVKSKMADDDPLSKDMDQIMSAAERAANLTRGLLAFSRKQVIRQRAVNLNTVIANIEKLLRRVVSEDVEMSVILSREELTVLADSGQIEQILMNLVANAKDAMSQQGYLIIRTEALELDREFSRMHGYGKEGMYALVSISDTGAGMDKKTKDRIFEPFFTTKEVGRGTGLGLSIVYGIVKQHNGYITSYSEPGKGATFKIYLPMIKDRIQERETVDLHQVKGGSETILVAEDDSTVRGLVRAILEHHGYQVIDAADGEEAIGKFKENRDKIRLVILDVIMPKKNGKEVFDEIISLQTGVKAIFSSGYTADILHTKGIQEENLSFISKPILPTKLLKIVRETLDRQELT